MLGDEAPDYFGKIGRQYAMQTLRANHDPEAGIVRARICCDGTLQEGKSTLPFWNSPPPASGGLGFSGAEKFAIMCLGVYRHLKSGEHLQFARDVWDYYRTQDRPAGGLLFPGKLAGQMALSLDLHDLTGERRYLRHAQEAADLAIQRLLSGGLFRAATGRDYYEAAMGPGALALELLRLHVALTGVAHELPRNYWDR